MLRSLAAEPGRGSVAAVATSLELDRSTAHRYVTTLRTLGYVEARHGGPRYRLTPRAAEPGRSALQAHAFASGAQSQLDALKRRSGCTVRVAVPLSLDALIVATARSSAEGQGLLGVQARVGAVLPGWCTALGKALIAGLDLAALDPDLRRTARNRRASLHRTRHLACAIEDEEHLPSVSAIAVPILLPDRVTPAAPQENVTPAAPRKDGTPAAPRQIETLAAAREGRAPAASPPGGTPVASPSRRTLAAIDVVGCAPQVTIATLLRDCLPDLLATARGVEAALGSRRPPSGGDERARRRT